MRDLCDESPWGSERSGDKGRRGGGTQGKLPICQIHMPGEVWSYF